MRPRHAALLGLAWLHAAAALRRRADAEEPHGGGPGPVVLVGVGRRPTASVKQLLAHLGVDMCRFTRENVSHANEEDDGMGHYEDFYTKKMSKFIPELLQASSGRASKSFRYHDSDVFWDAVKGETTAARLSRECIKYEQRHKLKQNKKIKNNFTWGYKNLDHIFLLPVVDEAFYRKERIVAVVRDPRTTCAGANKEEFAKWQDLVNNPSNSSTYTLTGEAACHLYWANIWKSLLAEYGEEKRFKVVRIEDLVMPKPSQDNKALDCLLQHAGVSPQEEKKRKRLRMLHVLLDTYSQAKSGAEALVASTGGVLHEVMEQLGYQTDAFGQTTPKSRAVCRL